MKQKPDLLTVQLAPLRLEGAFISSWNMSGPWAFLGPSESCALIHFVVEGQVVVQTDDCAPLSLNKGDVALFPHGTAHRIGDSITTPASSLDRLLPERRKGGFSELAIGAEGPRLQMLCAGLHYEPSGVMPLYELLPTVLIVRSTEIAEEPMLSYLLRGLFEEAHRVRDGKNLVLLRCLELIYILAVRLAFASSSATGALSEAIHDPRISRTLLRMYTEYSKRWTVEALAADVGMSRSSFCHRFRNLVGETPARHLTKVRLAEAKQLLRTTTLRQEEIALRVGYESTVGMHLAFRSVLGETPGMSRLRSRDAIEASDSSSALAALADVPSMQAVLDDP